MLRRLTVRSEQSDSRRSGGHVVVQYLYVHDPSERFDYPSSRSSGGSARLAARYLECVLVQAASLRLLHADCELALVSNLTDREVLGRRGVRLLEKIESLGVEVVHAEYHHRPTAEMTTFAASRYVFDAILAIAERGDPARQLWMVDVDCIWPDPGRVFAAAPPSPGIGYIHIPYPPDWELYGFTPRTMEELVLEMSAPGFTPALPLRWVGGELLSGTAADLSALVESCESLEREVRECGKALTTEEQLLSLAQALGRASFHDLAGVARRIWTGPRHGAPAVADPGALGLWHLPSEKGLGFRRAARAVLHDRTGGLERDLKDPRRALRRFNISGTGPARRVRDDSWIAARRLGDALQRQLGR
jgi:hypothetical protein